MQRYRNQVEQFWWSTIRRNNNDQQLVQQLLSLCHLVSRCSNFFLPRRSHEDLVEFLKEDVYVDYNPRMYDVLRRNCNHFSNELAQFLLHGKQLWPGWSGMIRSLEAWRLWYTRFVQDMFFFWFLYLKLTLQYYTIILIIHNMQHLFIYVCVTFVCLCRWLVIGSIGAKNGCNMWCWLRPEEVLMQPEWLKDAGSWWYGMVMVWALWAFHSQRIHVWNIYLDWDYFKLL
jgi:hypothetical protein